MDETDKFNLQHLEDYFGNYEESALVDKLKKTPSNDDEDKNYTLELTTLMKETFIGLQEAYNTNRHNSNTYERVYKERVERKVQLLCRFLLQGMGLALHKLKQNPGDDLYDVRSAYESAKCVYRNTWKSGMFEPDYKKGGLYPENTLEEHCSYDDLIKNGWYIVSIMVALFDTSTSEINYLDPYDSSQYFGDPYNCDKVIKEGKLHITNRNDTIDIHRGKMQLVTKRRKSFEAKGKEKWYFNWRRIFNSVFGNIGSVVPYDLDRISTQIITTPNMASKNREENKKFVKPVGFKWNTTSAFTRRGGKTHHVRRVCKTRRIRNTRK